EVVVDVLHAIAFADDLFDAFLHLLVGNAAIQTDAAILHPNRNVTQVDAVKAQCIENACAYLFVPACLPCTRSRIASLIATLRVVLHALFSSMLFIDQRPLSGALPNPSERDERQAACQTPSARIRQRLCQCGPHALPVRAGPEHAQTGVAGRETLM